MYLSYEELIKTFKKRGNICIGIDLPANLSKSELTEWVYQLFRDTYEYALAYKLNINYFEYHYWEGLTLLLTFIKYAGKSHIIIIDSKKWDIKKSMEIGINAWLNKLGADGITILPAFTRISDIKPPENKYLLPVIYPTESSPIHLVDNYYILLARDLSQCSKSHFIPVVNARDSHSYAQIREILPDWIFFLPGIISQEIQPEKVLAMEKQFNKIPHVILNIGSAIYRMTSSQREKLLKKLLSLCIS